MGCGSAITVWGCVGERSLFWGCLVWESDRFLGMFGVRSLLGFVECYRCLGCGESAIAKRCCKQFAFGTWECDRCLGMCGGAIAFWGCGDAIALVIE
ncbi:hypothetical protein [Dolichospermum compactum]|uniref:hypothetical protein n=1 Tax=Dolichospermum compactum TaxID=136073 RepID=UPI0012FD0756|nr:hypothetical protein [Dolichospermum compactum]